MDLLLRKAESGDIENVLLLSNDERTRKFSINSEKISWEQHVIWFNKILNAKDAVLYIITDDQNSFIGQIRFDICKRKAVISISLVEEAKGQGYGSKALRLSHESVLKEYRIEEITAYINERNTASIRLFEKAGYLYRDQENSLLRFVFRLEE